MKARSIWNTVLLNFLAKPMKIVPEPKSVKLYPYEWETLRHLAQQQGISRHRLLTQAARSIIADSYKSQNPDAA